MGKKQKGTAGAHDGGTLSTAEVQEVIKLACHNRTEDMKEHKLRPSPGTSKDKGKVSCGWCNKNNISADKRTVVDHMKSKAHLISKGDLEQQEEKRLEDIDLLMGWDKPMGSSDILAHPQIAGVILAFLPFKFQGRCAALSKKVRKNIVDAVADISILDLCVVFQPLELTAQSYDQRALRKAIFGKASSTTMKKRGKGSNKTSAVASEWPSDGEGEDGDQEWQREPTHDEPEHLNYWQKTQKAPKSKTDYAVDASKRLQWSFLQLRKAHKTPEKAEYWIQRLKELIFVPVDSAPHKNAEQLGMDHVLLLPPCFECTPRTSSIFMHISSPRVPSALTIIDRSAYEGDSEGSRNYLKDVKRVDLVVGPGLDCPNFGKQRYYSSRDAFVSLEYLTVRNVGSRVKLRDYFCTSQTTIRTVVIVGERHSCSSEEPLMIDLPKEFFCRSSSIEEIHFVGIDGIRAIGSSCCRNTPNLTVFDLSLLREVETFPRRCFYRCPMVTREAAEKNFIGLREVTKRKGGRLQVGGSELITAAYQLNEGDTTIYDDYY